MAFLNKAALQRTAEATQVADHPLLKNGDIPMNVKQAYVQGCVLATLMDDEKVSDDERTAVRKIGKSLRLDDVAIQECFDVILGLQSQDDKLACLNEIITAIGTGDARIYFMIDFEQLLCLHGVPNEDGYGVLDYIGNGLLKKEDWRRDVFEFEKVSFTADTAKRYIIAAEQTGNKWDCHVAGVILFNGEGIPKDEERAFKLFLKAGDSGVPAAQRQVGLLYLAGRCVKNDEHAAAKWLQKAASAGDKIGQWAWGRCLFDGIGAAQDMSEAVKWFMKAAEAGVVLAQVQLADCYRKGQGIQEDDQLAIKWYGKAIDQGDASALVGLGECYEEGVGVPKDCAKAVDYYMQAARKNYVLAYTKIGICFEEGIGVEKNLSECVKWYKKGADGGNGFSQFQLGFLYFNGYGVNKDECEGFKYFMMAAIGGDATAQYNVGLCYANGFGVTHDLDSAIKWYRKSAAQGDEKAKKELDRLEGIQKQNEILRNQKASIIKCPNCGKDVHVSAKTCWFCDYVMH